MAIVKEKSVNGELDRPLPERIKNPTKADIEKMNEILNKYKKIAAHNKKGTM